MCRAKSTDLESYSVKNNAMSLERVLLSRDVKFILAISAASSPSPQHRNLFASTNK
jgi:hypothetical protein